MDLQSPEAEKIPVTTETLSGRNHPKVLASVLSYLGQDQPWKVIEQTKTLSLDQILYQPWAERRVQRAMGYFTSGPRGYGSPFPSIEVFAYRIQHPQTNQWLTFYDVNDGNHRCTAAERCGELSIRAEISSEITIDPASFVCSISGCGSVSMNSLYNEEKCLIYSLYIATIKTLV
ncbi:MAG: hypothetical protein AAF632_21860 [Bacteroidota bacterium]